MFTTWSTVKQIVVYLLFGILFSNTKIKLLIDAKAQANITSIMALKNKDQKHLYVLNNSICFKFKKTQIYGYRKQISALQTCRVGGRDCCKTAYGRFFGKM